MLFGLKTGGTALEANLATWITILNTHILGAGRPHLKVDSHACTNIKEGAFEAAFIIVTSWARAGGRSVAWLRTQLSEEHAGS